MGLDEELGIEADEHDHSAEAHAAEVSEETTSLEVEGGDVLHPWAQAMYRRGLSFNGNERTRLFLNAGEQGFLDLSDVSGADSPLDGRALLAADFDNDLDVDLFVHNIQRERHNLFRNDMGGRNAIKLRLRATTGQYEAIGARVVVNAGGVRSAQLVTRGGGFASCQAPELLFGLGKATDGSVEVHWPWGAVESFGKVPAGSRALLVEGFGKPQDFQYVAAPLPDPWADGLKLADGEVIPNLVFASRDGERVEIDLGAEATAADGSVWLCFWASYCRPCVAELPLLEELHQQEGTAVIALSVDVPDDRERAASLLERGASTFPSYYLASGDEDNEEGLDRLVDLLRLPIPTAIQVGPDGSIRQVIQGPLPGLPSLVSEMVQTPR